MSRIYFTQARRLPNLTNAEIDRIQTVLDQWERAESLRHQPRSQQGYDYELVTATVRDKYAIFACDGASAYILDLLSGTIYISKSYSEPNKKKPVGNIKDSAFDGAILAEYRKRGY